MTIDKGKLQADEYAFPYHYMPIFEENPQITRHWSFAPSYLAALGLVKERIFKFASASENQKWKHIDIGCGDGALLFHISRDPLFQSEIELHGIDYDARALEWARMFNDRATILEQDIAELRAESYDSASLVEVAEHIPPEELPSFLTHAASALKTNGRIIVTVPSVEKPVQKKHYQHFSFDLVHDYASNLFDVEEIYGFEKHGVASKILYLMIYRSPIRVELPLSARHIVRKFGQLHRDQKGCGRILAILKKK